MFLCSCGGGNSNSGGNSAPDAEPDSIFTPKYAKWFRIEYYSDHKKAVVLDPWNGGKTLASYTLSNISYSDNSAIQIPIRSVAVGSCTQVAFIDNIGEVKTIKGVCSSNLIYCPTIRQRVADGTCNDLGDSFSIDYERTLLINPDVVFVTAYNQTDAHTLRLKESGLPVIGTVEWIEPDVLGRAEWIKFFAAFYNKEVCADSVFNSVESEYLRLKDLASQATDKPSVLPGLTFKGTWYMPAGNSFMSQLFTDAGGDYKFATDSTSGSLPLGFEYVVKNFSDCDVWVGLDIDSYAELLERDCRLSVFKAFKNKNVWNQNKRRTATGGNDFWENGVVHPDYLLQDLITIFHPTLLPADSTTFLQPLR